MVFVCFLAFYLAGFASDDSLSKEALLLLRLFIAFITTLALVYAQIFLESKNPVMIRQLLLLFKAGNWKELALNLPAPQRHDPFPSNASDIFLNSSNLIQTRCFHRPAGAPQDYGRRS